jgi:hypothetical protein
MGKKAIASIFKSGKNIIRRKHGRKTINT